MSKARFLVVENKVTRGNQRDVVEFQRLSTRAGSLKVPGKKRLVRLQVKLQREGVIVAATQEHLRSAARDLYHSLPWWKKLHLRVRYLRRRVYVWSHNKLVSFKRWWVTR